MKKFPRTFLLYVYFTLMLSYAGVNSFLTIRQVSFTSRAGWMARVKDNVPVIVSVNPTGPSPMLRAGDEVVEVKSPQLPDATSTTGAIWKVRPEYPYSITVRRDQTLQTYSLATGAHSVQWIASNVMGSVIVPAFFLITALVIFLLRRDDEQVQLLAVMLGTYIFDGPYQAAGLPLPVIWLLLVGGTVSTLGPATVLHFFLKFPNPSPIIKRFPATGYVLYLPALIFLIPFAVINYYYWAFSPSQSALLDQRFPFLAAGYNYAVIAYIAAGLLSLLWSYKRAGELERRKVRVILAGFVFGATPFMLWNLFPAMGSAVGVSPRIIQWSLLGAFTALLLLPISFSYAIVRHQVIPVSMIARRSLRYLFVARGFALVQVAVAFFILNLLLSGNRAALLHQYGEQGQLFIEVGAAMALLLFTRMIHSRIRPLIDKRFFRERYDVKEILSDLGHAFIKEPDGDRVLRHVAAKIQGTLHAENVAAWALDPVTGDYQFVFSLSHASASSTKSAADLDEAALPVLPKDSLTVQLLSESKQALSVNISDPQSWVHARLKQNNNEGRDLRLQEYEALKTVDAALLLSVATKESVKYIISLGSRLNDLPYSKEDVQMLSSVVWLTSFAVENLDLIERERKNQEQLRQSQKMEAVGRLAGGIAHDFNNLLTVIGGNTDLAQRKLGTDDPVLRNLSEIKKASERATDLTRQLLAFSRKQVLQPKVLQLNSVVADIQKMLKQVIGEDVDLLTVLDPSLGFVKADPGQIEQVLMNLVVNARDAMPRGGKLTIETAEVYLDKDYVSGHNSVLPGPYVMLAVSDTGCGMDARTKERIFEPFYTTKEVGKGTGLGLATVYGIVKQSGGNIWVYSEVGRGTTFKVYLPVVQGQKDLVQRPAVQVELAAGSETVLLVEDEVLVRNMASEILKMSGYNVLEASHGKEALAITQAFDKPIHLMVTDVVMPQMSGPELATLLEKSSPQIKVLYMSGYTDEAIVHHGVLDDGVAFLEKPFTAGAFARKVREVLNA